MADVVIKVCINETCYISLVIINVTIKVDTIIGWNYVCGWGKSKIFELMYLSYVD